MSAEVICGNVWRRRCSGENPRAWKPISDQSLGRPGANGTFSRPLPRRPSKLSYRRNRATHRRVCKPRKEAWVSARPGRSNGVSYAVERSVEATSGLGRTGVRSAARRKAWDDVASPSRVRGGIKSEAGGQLAGGGSHAQWLTIQTMGRRAARSWI